MSFKSLMTDLGMKVVKKKPEIMLGAGVILGIGAGVMLVRNTFKLQPVLLADRETLKQIKEMEEDPSAKVIVEQGETDDEPTLYAPYDKDVADHDRKEVAKNMTKNYIKAYVGPVAMGVASLALILMAFNAKHKALLATTALLNTTTASFKAYRGEVIKRYGADVDNDIILGKHTEVVETVDEDGNVKVEEKTVINPIGKELVLQYDKTWSTWRNDVSYLRWEMSRAQKIAHSAYETRNTKHLYLLEVTDSLGAPREVVMPYSGMGWSEKLDSEDITLKLCLDNAYIDRDEDGDYVAYIPITLDGMIS